jgi:hypothetical protein
MYPVVSPSLCKNCLILNPWNGTRMSTGIIISILQVKKLSIRKDDQIPTDKKPSKCKSMLSLYVS